MWRPCEARACQSSVCYWFSWLIGVVLAFLPMDPKVKNIIIAIVAVLVVVWLCEMLGLFTIGTFGMHRFR